MNICCYNNRPERRNPRIKYVYLPGPAGPAGSTGATGATGSTQASETLATNFSAQPSAQAEPFPFTTIYSPTVRFPEMHQNPMSSYSITKAYIR